MHVTNVRVSFFREKQPAQFEKSHPAVEFAAVLDDGENHEAIARDLMISATRVVYNGLGYDVPEKVAAALANGDVPAELSVDTETTNAPEVEPEHKKRGRPAGSKNTGPKKETAKAKRLREAAEAAEAAAEDAGGLVIIPGDDDKSAISTGGSRVGPDDDPADHGIPGDKEDAQGDDGIPGDDGGSADDAPGETEFDPKALHTLIMSHVNASPRTLSVADAKRVLAHFKVARAQDLTMGQALEGKAMVDEMVSVAEKD